MDLDQVFQSVIGYGPFQKRIIWCIGLSNVFQSFHNLHNVYLGAEPKFVCTQKGQEFDHCPKDNSECDSIKFIGTDFTSIVSEWNLVCQDAYKAQFVQSIFMIGIMTGNLVGGILADRWGRRHLTYCAILWMGLFSLLGAFADSYQTYAVLRGLVGCGGGMLGLVGFVLVTELINQPERNFVGMVYPTIFAVGISIFSILAFCIRDWKQLTIFTAMPGLLGFYLYRLLPESPRWLYGIKQREAAENALTKIVIKNTGAPPKEEIVLKDNSDLASFVKAPSDQLSMLGILMHPILRGWTIVSAFTWFVCCAVYYGLTFGAGNLGDNMYISVSLSGLVEIPANFLTFILMERIGRRYTYSWSMLCGGVMCLAILLLPEAYPNMKVVLALLGKMSISVSFCVNWVYTTEFYPTPIRNKGLGISNMAARFGGVFSPMILALGTMYASVDFLIFGVLALVGGIVALRLPETNKKPMPETLADLQLLLK